MAGNVAYRYAKAWMKQVLEDKVLETTLQDVELISATLEGSKDLGLFLKSPMINRTVKKDTLEEIFKSRVSESTFRFIELLLSRHREGFLGQVVSVFRSMYRDAAGILDAEIRSALSLTDAAVKEISDRLSTITKKSVEVTLIVDESLIGGISVRLGDQVIDGTVKHQLEKLKEQFSE